MCPCVKPADLCDWDQWRTQLWSLAVSPGRPSCSQVLCSWTRVYLYESLGFPLESRDCHFCLRGCVTIYSSISWQLWKPKVRPGCVQGLGYLICHRSLAGQLVRSSQIYLGLGTNPRTGGTGGSTEPKSGKQDSAASPVSPPPCFHFVLI